jgi:hypothetical protein
VRDRERAGALGPAELVGGQDEGVGVELGERELAGGLDGVDVDQRAGGAGGGDDPGSGDRAELVVDRGERDQTDAVQGSDLQGALARHADRPELPAARHDRGDRAAQRRVVDDRGRDDARQAALLGDRREAQDAERVALGAAAGEHDLLPGSAEQARDALAGLLDVVSYPTTLGVDR